MSRLKHFLNTLSNIELAQFYRYRFDQFLPNSRQMIIDEMNRRNMEPEYLEQYIIDKSNDETTMKAGECCPRCYSSKFYTAEEKETVEYKYETVEVDAYYKTCLVCLFSPEKPENYERYRLVSFFGFLRALRKRRR